ncbi:MAG: glycine--tRNA ligase subunit beta [Gammaproteobacteria bacterium]|nr:glycine--tRNA ligase subunit beta [Gammaproteobacteria bacterium]
MMKSDDFLLEIQTEEIPSKQLMKISHALSAAILQGLKKESLTFDSVLQFATPRRLAVLIKGLIAQQPDQLIEKRGPAVAQAYDTNGAPTPACLGFARGQGITVEELVVIQNDQGSWVANQQSVPGKKISELMPPIMQRAVEGLPITRKMRWGTSDIEFIRPVHSVIMLYGDEIVHGQLFGLQASRATRGHRFYAPGWITIPHASMYESLLNTEGFVIADFAKRRLAIQDQSFSIVKSLLKSHAEVVMHDALLDEVTGLVEWPNACLGSFEAEFLKLPQEVLISSMEDHQRYFPIIDAAQKLLPHFIFISNILSKKVAQVVRGNERVLRARLADAAFFYATDQKNTLKSRIDALAGVVFQAKLGTLKDRAERLQKLMTLMAEPFNLQQDALHAGLLAKSDLTTLMVNEFPELQGVMGSYYALHDGETTAVATAIKEHYLPRFAGDQLPETVLGSLLALADRIDLLVGTFGINQPPTGDKDPFGLRRAAIGVVRILIEKKLNIDLRTLLSVAYDNYAEALDNKEAVADVLLFIEERMRVLYQEQGVSSDIFAAVSALHLHNPLDIDARIKAVRSFKQLNEANALSIANKRVSNILNKYTDQIAAQSINPALFESVAEKDLSQQLESKYDVIKALSTAGKYDEVLLSLAQLRQPIDTFFDQVMVMSDDKQKRENRILLLGKLRALFLQVADIALLQ